MQNQQTQSSLVTGLFSDSVMKQARIRRSAVRTLAGALANVSPSNWENVITEALVMTSDYLRNNGTKQKPAQDKSVKVAAETDTEQTKSKARKPKSPSNGRKIHDYEKVYRLVQARPGMTATTLASELYGSAEKRNQLRATAQLYNLRNRGKVTVGDGGRWTVKK